MDFENESFHLRCFFKNIQTFCHPFKMIMMFPKEHEAGLNFLFWFQAQFALFLAPMYLDIDKIRTLVKDPFIWTLS